jgi:hypothetical protein
MFCIKTTMLHAEYTSPASFTVFGTIKEKSANMPELFSYAYTVELGYNVIKGT